MNQTQVQGTPGRFGWISNHNDALGPWARGRRADLGVNTEMEGDLSRASGMI
jgi:glutamate dehydrogenase/leucine dehydrogenase